MSAPLRFAMIGCGSHATNAIFPSIRYADMELVAACDLDDILAQRNARRFGAQQAYTDYRRMLEELDLDAVGVVGPPDMHVTVGVEVLESGRDLFVEKPPGNSLEDTRRLSAAAETAGRQVMVGFMKRHARAYRRAKAISQSADFGTPRLLRLNYSHWRVGDLRKHLTVMSTHPLDLARVFLGDVIGGAIFKRKVADEHVVALLLEHHEGGVSQISLSALEPRLQESLELSGDSSLITVRNLTELTFHPPASDLQSAVNTDESMARLWYPEFTIPLPGNDSLELQGYAGELRHFAESIKNKTPVSPGIADGVEAMRLVEAIHAAPEGVSELRIPN